jgi:hypothetical protein
LSASFNPTCFIVYREIVSTPGEGEEFQPPRKKSECPKCTKKIVNVKRHMLKCIRSEQERNTPFSNSKVNKQDKRTLTNIKSWQCLICRAFYMFPKSHSKNFHSKDYDQESWKNFFSNPITPKTAQTEIDKKMQDFENNYLLNPKASALDLKANSNWQRTVQCYKNRAKETIIYATGKLDPTIEDILQGVSHLCDSFPEDQVGKHFKEGTVKNKLVSFQHYLIHIEFQVKCKNITLDKTELSNSLKCVQNTIKSLRGRIKMRDSVVAMQRSRFFWSEKDEERWLNDPQTIQAEKLLNSPQDVGKDKSKFVMARNQLILKISKRNGKRNLEMCSMKIEHTVEPNCRSGLNNRGQLEWVLYNQEVKTKKSGGISKISLDKGLMEQLLNYIQVIRPNFKSSKSANSVFTSQRGNPFSPESMSSLWNSLMKFYEGPGRTSNQNFRQMFGRLANEYGSSKQRRISSDQQDHSEATTSQYYEQNYATSISAVNQNEEFNKKANQKEMLTQAAREGEEGVAIRKKMKSIRELEF